MIKLTEQQIEAVYNWLKEWEILDETVIPLRFKEQFSKQFNTPRVSVNVETAGWNTLTPHRCPVCGGNGIVARGFYMQTSGQELSRYRDGVGLMDANGWGCVQPRVTRN